MFKEVDIEKSCDFDWNYEYAVINTTVCLLFVPVQSHRCIVCFYRCAVKIWTPSSVKSPRRGGRHVSWRMYNKKETRCRFVTLYSSLLSVESEIGPISHCVRKLPWVSWCSVSSVPPRPLCIPYLLLIPLCFLVRCVMMEKAIGVFMEKFKVCSIVTVGGLSVHRRKLFKGYSETHSLRVCLYCGFIIKQKLTYWTDL